MKNIAVLDLESDPFAYGRVPLPFVAQYYDGSKRITIWGDDCIERMALALAAEPPAIIYAHNGGKFDWMYFLEHMHSAMRIVNGRIIQCYLGKHELRDSYSIIPVPLATYKKKDIDYTKMERAVRESNRDEIIEYLDSDCDYLYTLVTAFIDEFGEGLTIGGSALKQLRKFHQFKTGGPGLDEKFRSRFYFGGRNQVFKSGIIHAPIKIYDINSEYPYVMKAFRHPVSSRFEVSPRIEPNTAFVVSEGKNYGAFPVRKPDGGLDFTCESGVFCCTIHEWHAALDTGTYRPSRIKITYNFNELDSFGDFVDHFYSARMAAKAIDDKIHTLFYKLVLNSAYGKFAQNPENFCEYMITKWGHTPNTSTDPAKFEWSEAYIFHGKYVIWEKPLARQNWYNVATGASITGAARSLLLRGLAGAQDPLYVDTDSIICSGLRGVRIDENELGAWKIEAEGTHAAIAGKKLYAVYDGDTCIKKAHKGARLTGADILKIAQGETVVYENPVPRFQFDGSGAAVNGVFIKRRIRMTA